MRKKMYFCNMKCNICPRKCNAERAVSLGFCNAKPQPEAATICAHLGEEPPLSGQKGICNIFFAHCNLQCIFCQNHAISGATLEPGTTLPFVGIEAIVDQVERVLKETENMVGFVTPSHYAHCIPDIVEALHNRGLFPTTVYNTSGYDSVETLRKLAPYIDIYLPDFKYIDPALAKKYSHAENYPEVALKALKEMYNQKGSALPTDDNDLAYRGIIIRHLVLPGHIQNSIDVLDAIADISTNLHVALMAQYYPPFDGLPEPLNRTLTEEEYQKVTDHFYNIGLHKGWVQELDSQHCYRPDFTQKNAFR